MDGLGKKMKKASTYFDTAQYDNRSGCNTVEPWENKNLNFRLRVNHC
jgi:hypothetical protein